MIDPEHESFPKAPKNKPYRVVIYRRSYYWKPWECVTKVFDFRWYWQANMVSWFYHHILGYGCNTWKIKQ
jgi:hypothetical protein